MDHDLRQRNKLNTLSHKLYISYIICYSLIQIIMPRIQFVLSAADHAKIELSFRFTRIVGVVSSCLLVFSFVLCVLSAQSRRFSYRT